MPIDFTNLPKTELHIHLEGSIPVEALYELVKKHGRLDEAPTIDHVRKRYEFDDFAHFLEVYKWTVSFLKGADDYEFVAYEVAKTLADQNVWFTEVMVGLGNSVAYGHHDPLEIVRAAWHGFQRAEAEFGTRIRVQIATGRDHGVDFSVDRLNDIKPLLNEVDICAFNMGGSEHVHPLPQYKKVFDLAHDMGLQVSLHAGEVSSPKDIYDALDMDAQRIGHGIRAVQDSALMKILVDRNVPLEVCPVSNECTGAVDKLADHPLQQLIDAGLPLTLSSDDPAMFHTSVSNEYQVAHEVLGVDCPTLVRLARNGFEYAFTTDTERRELLARFDTEARAWCKERGIEFPS
ncbi:adenosine deaminase [Planctomycetota bacterium]|nr:adenosine deaminase [Planctomycetota bacterium]